MYSRNELRTALIAYYRGYRSEEDINEMFDEIFSPLTSSYSVNGNTLTLTGEFESETYTETLTRK